MDAEENGKVLAQKPSNRRSAPRLPVDGPASLLFLKHGASVACRVVDLSLGGCLIEAQEQLLACILLRVEVSFKVNGLAFRFNGVTQWTDGRCRVGIRFVDLPSRRKDELAELLCEVEQENAAKAAKQAAKKIEEPALEEVAESCEEPQPGPTLDSRSVCPVPMREQPAVCAVVDPGACLSQESRAAASLPGTRSVISAEAEVQSAPSVQRLAKPAKRERRTQSRHEVDTSAVIYLVNVGSKLPGRILDLSMGGCRIRTDERFPVGIYTRVETEFRLEGLPFRLGGVIQSIHDQQQVGLRFLDMSDRKREQVEQLIEEIEEMRAGQRLSGSHDPADFVIGA
jgi:hypothetical protein